MPLLEIKSLTCKAGNKTILDDLSMALEVSEVHALLGTNGTGKSTLAYIIMGCEGYRPTAGEILFEGKAISPLKIHERARLGITMAWQEPVRLEGISVRDYLTLKIKGSDPYPYLELVGLDPERYMTRMVDKSLSGGERKRIELASLLALNPKVVILDEPDSGIDMVSMKDLTGVIKAFRDKGATVLLITHREEIAMIADRASLLCFGRIVRSGDPKNVADFYISRECLKCEKGEVCDACF